MGFGPRDSQHADAAVLELSLPQPLDVHEVGEVERIEASIANQAGALASRSRQEGHGLRRLRNGHAHGAAAGLMCVGRGVTLCGSKSLGPNWLLAGLNQPDGYACRILGALPDLRASRGCGHSCWEAPDVRRRLLRSSGGAHVVGRRHSGGHEGKAADHPVGVKGSW